MVKETPLMKQYKEIKSQYEDSILFFRLGDFYEMFFEDAVTSSKELGITLTSRNKEKDQEVPLAGVPFHSAASYISKLVAKGYKVAICEQVEDPKEAKGIVKREVIKVITPGTVIDTEYLDEKSNNYLLGIEANGEVAALAYVDITTGEFRVTEVSGENLILKVLNEVHKVAPNEIVVNEAVYNKYKQELDNYAYLSEVVVNRVKGPKNCEELLKEYFNVVSLESYGLSQKEVSILACGMTLNYILELQKHAELPIDRIAYDSMEEYMELNLTTQRNLELTRNQNEKTSHGTLLWVLDRCKTSMGTRLLKKFIKNPLMNPQKIRERQGDIGYFIEEVLVREEIKEKLKEVYDLERLMGKIILGTENARDLIAMKKSIKSILEIIKILGEKQLFQTNIEELVGIYNLIEKSICDEPPFSVREGNIVKRGYDSYLDELHQISKSGKDYLIAIETKEKEKSGIKNLKIKYNKVFGYFLEVTKSNVHLVPQDYIRKQTLSNAERYITSELKEYESKILNAKEKIEALEYELFKRVSAKLKDSKLIIKELAYGVSYLDVIVSLADVATKNNYVCPEISADYGLEIKDGRHPIVEKLIGEEKFVKNSIKMDEEERIIILTGPNMAGKSTYMKQNALIILMAQIGSYVPATYAKVGVVDKIFTRVGASDDLVSGQSTFMVEMSEVANIVNNSTENSFVILDEVGRGTSTFDGISIASSITEYIHDKIGAKTIFATHYHELTELENNYEKMVNFRIEVKETQESVIFLREIVRGGADKSYGIEVARLAGLPKEILKKSKHTLKMLEEKRAIIEKKIKGEQLLLFGGQNVVPAIEEEEDPKEILSEGKKLVLDELEAMDLNNTTPLDALFKLNEFKKKLREEL